jgi:hypothetical protein
LVSSPTTVRPSSLLSRRCSRTDLFPFTSLSLHPFLPPLPRTQARVEDPPTPSRRSTPPWEAFPPRKVGTPKPSPVPSSRASSSATARSRSSPVVSSSLPSCRPVDGGALSFFSSFHAADEELTSTSPLSFRGLTYDDNQRTSSSILLIRRETEADLVFFPLKQRPSRSALTSRSTPTLALRSGFVSPTRSTTTSRTAPTLERSTTSRRDGPSSLALASRSLPRSRCGTLPTLLPSTSTTSTSLTMLPPLTSSVLTGFVFSPFLLFSHFLSDFFLSFLPSQQYPKITSGFNFATGGAQMQEFHDKYCTSNGIKFAIGESAFSFLSLLRLPY